MTEENGIQELKERIAAFRRADFSDMEITENLMAEPEGRVYKTPPVNPPSGEHPRVLFRKGDLPAILAAMESEENAFAVTEYKRLLAMETDGVLPEITVHKNGLHNFDLEMLNAIQAMAMQYQLTGDRAFGYRAILAMKNFILTMNIVSISSDQCRQYGNTMYAAACVYDWCYDLMTDDDRMQFVLGIEHRICRGRNEKGAKMEVGFPPIGQGAVSGHGSERQIPRDYLAFAIAIYDEHPGWWEMIGGRFYEEYVPVREYFYRAGMYPQGVSNYVRARFVSDLWALWLLRNMGAPSPFTDRNMREVMRTAFSYEVAGGYTFNTGDSGSATAKFNANYGTCALLSSYLFRDPTMRAQALYYGHGIRFFEHVSSFATPTESLILSSNRMLGAKDRHEGMPLLRYNGGWLGQIIAHRSWDDPKAPSALMKIGVRSTANHDHQDAGQFQLFYRSLLAGDTGCYARYGSDHWSFYHQATLGHNSLLIYNPARADDPLYKGFYSGGQRKLRETASFEAWKTELYDNGTVLAHEVAYRDAAETDPEYAYIAGDITLSYDAETVSGVERRMLTVFPKSGNAPMLFVVYDSITARDAAFRKTFLLHTVTEPKIEGNRISEINGDGKLVLISILGADSVTALGGAGKNFLVNGTQVKTENGSDDGFWGRVEISPAAGNLTDRLLNVFYVCDADDDPALRALRIDGEGFSGTAIGEYAFLFAEGAADTVSALLPGSGEKTVFFSSVSAGDWTVIPENAPEIRATVTEDGRLLHCTVPAGRVTFRRCSGQR